MQSCMYDKLYTVLNYSPKTTTPSTHTHTTKMFFCKQRHVVYRGNMLRDILQNHSNVTQRTTGPQGDLVTLDISSGTETGRRKRFAKRPSFH